MSDAENQDSSGFPGEYDAVVSEAKFEHPFELSFEGKAQTRPRSQIPFDGVQNVAGVLLINLPQILGNTRLVGDRGGWAGAT